VQIDAVNAGVWVAWAVVTLVAGVAALVGTNPGFGTWLDFVKCFFWGLGAQIVGDRLQDAKPSQVAASLGVTLPTS
jgi:hypothetical protein